MEITFTNQKWDSIKMSLHKKAIKSEEKNMKKNAIYRILRMYTDLLDGKELNMRELTHEFGVNVRTIRRDITEIRDFLAERMVETGEYMELAYDRRRDRYILKGV